MRWLLDIFRFLHDIAAVGGGFQHAVQQNRGGVSRLRCLAARRYTDIAVGVHIGREGQEAEWEYELRFNQDNLQKPILKSELVRHRGKDVLKRPLPDDTADPARLTQTFLEQVNANREFRDVVEFLATVRYLHVVPQLVREPDRSVGKRNDPFGGDFLEQIGRAAEKTRNARLRRIAEALSFAVPQLKELEIHKDSRGVPHLRGKYEHWRPAGAWQSEVEFSDGTLRLMGLLWSLLDGSGPLLLEEPELSLHQEIIRFIPQLFARVQSRTGRQVIVSTHSAELLRDEGIGMDEVLLLTPTDEGTSVKPISEFTDVETLLNSGLSLPEAILPRTRPKKASQLALFGED